MRFTLSKSKISATDNEKRAVTVLLDGMLRPWAITHRLEDTPQTIQWGKLALTVRVVSLQPKPRLEASHAWLQRQLDCLPTIATLAENGRIKLYSTIEIDFEGWGRPGVIGKGSEVDLLRNVKIEKISPALTRTMLWGGKESETKEKKQAFLDAIRRKRFLELKTVIHPKHSGDIFHLWSAEKAHLDCFLSADSKFINAVNNAKRNRRGIQINVDVLSPSELCERLALRG